MFLNCFTLIFKSSISNSNAFKIILSKLLIDLSDNFISIFLVSMKSKDSYNKAY